MKDLGDNIVIRLPMSIVQLIADRPEMSSVVLTIPAEYVSMESGKAGNNQYTKKIKVCEDKKLSWIIGFVSTEFDVPIHIIRSTRREPKFIEARHIAVYLMVLLTDTTQVEIGNFFNRDHSSIHYAAMRAQSMLRDPALLKRVNALKEKIEKYVAAAS